MSNSQYRIKMAYYPGSDGPRIMLFGPNETDFTMLQAIFRELTQKGGPYEFHTLPFIETFGGIQLTARCAGSMFDFTRSTALGLRRSGSDLEPRFEWIRTSEGWDYFAELINGLIASPSPGHQYLTAFPSEDAIVVVSKGEYGDEVLKSG
jgi:hypothetical protein